MGNERPFGGKLIVFLGDFRQLLPVIINESPECMVEACIKNSYIWDYVREYKLSENLCRSTDETEVERFRWLVIGY